MHFHQYPYHANFEFVSRFDPAGRFRTRSGPGRLELGSNGDGIHRLGVRARGWRRQDSHTGLPRWSRVPANAERRVRWLANGRLEWRGANGDLLLASPPGRGFGRCGPASIFEFLRENGDRFYGQGEKWTGFEHDGRRSGTPTGGRTATPAPARNSTCRPTRCICRSPT